MSTDLQTRYQELLKQIETAKTDLVRAETTLEQKLKEKAEAKTKLTELTELEDEAKIKELLEEIDVQIKDLVEQAEALLNPKEQADAQS